ncbi:MAG: hypothetical protein ABFS14_13630, partial [Gemmatimonadota bacterium]
LMLVVSLSACQQKWIELKPPVAPQIVDEDPDKVRLHLAEGEMITVFGPMARNDSLFGYSKRAVRQARMPDIALALKDLQRVDAPRPEGSKAEPGLEPGTRVRILAAQVSADRLVGDIASISSDTLLLESDGEPSAYAVPIAAIEKIEVRKGSFPGSVAVMGLGGLIGLGFGLAARSDFDHCPSESPFAFCEFEPLVVPFAMGLGAMAGWLVSAPFARIENWKEFPSDKIAIRITPHSVGFALSF